MWTDWLTVPETAGQLGVTKVRVYQMIRSKALISTERWGRVFVSKLSVELERNFRRAIKRVKRKRQERLDGDAA